ncbi:0696c391-604c-4371-a8c8-67a801e50814 [Sclerotinia trifoliorum]|uniref:0696c391-604c-4371-a8c8-67a801e50814 n=1 Tax=Sclerotinia trifoliorum TaxID=28548 RepID=A0A8H2VLF3_9HELO|nr:0696c391-604c-4371-a8c8-67a801e50814 [Sclerotinia trifoliorum]
MGVLRLNPAMRHGISTLYNIQKFGDDELQLLFSALSSMPMLVKLYVVYTIELESNEAPFDNHGGLKWPAGTGTWGSFNGELA